MYPAAFFASALLVIVTPGPDLALITSMLTSYPHRRPAFQAAAGMISAGAVYAALDLAGLSVLLARRPSLLLALRIIGAGVLLGYSIRTFASWFGGEPGAASPRERRHPSHCFTIGFLSTIGNPKVGLFLLAFLPQFVPATGSPQRHLALLSASYLALGAAWLCTYIMAMRWICNALRSPKLMRSLEAVTGCAMIWLGLRMVLT